MPDPAAFRLSVVEGDLTKIEADAIVNAANSVLLAGGGVCGAIFRAAGVDELTAACRAIGECPTGAAVITPAFGIRTAKFIIHAVGPVYSKYHPAEARRLLGSAYAASIRLAAENGCTSIAFPSISTGSYGYPLGEACRTAVDVCRKDGAAAGLKITLAAFDGTAAQCLRRLIDAPA
jgi:O-acetyl-ADP-ribose deacetylase